MTCNALRQNFVFCQYDTRMNHIVSASKPFLHFIYDKNNFLNFMTFNVKKDLFTFNLLNCSKYTNTLSSLTYFLSFSKLSYQVLLRAVSTYITEDSSLLVWQQNTSYNNSNSMPKEYKYSPQHCTRHFTSKSVKLSVTLENSTQFLVLNTCLKRSGEVSAGTCFQSCVLQIINIHLCRWLD